MDTDKPTYYSVVQYVPDPVADERMNVGVLAYCGKSVRAQFVDSWRRASTFGKEKVDFLKEFAEEVQSKIAEPELGDLPGRRRLDEERIREVAGSWENSIQVTDPRASLKPVDALIERLTERFLRQSERTALQSRGRPQVRKLAFQTLLGHLGEAGAGYISRNAAIDGNLEAHQIDIGIGNGSPLVGAEGFSFEVQQTTRVKRDLDSTIYKLQDIRDRNPELRLGLVTLPPSDSNELYARAEALCNEIEIEFVEEGEIEDWADGVSQDVLSSLTNGATE